MNNDSTNTPNNKQQEFLDSIQDTFQELLKNHFDGSDMANIAIAESQKVRLQAEDLSTFLEHLIGSIVTGPLQEVFTGAEIITAINNNKAIAYSGAFIDMAEKAISLAFVESEKIERETCKDFRDFFALSMMSYLLDNGNNIQSIAGFTQGNTIADRRNTTFRSALNEFYFNYKEDDMTGPATLAVFLGDLFLGNEKEKNAWPMPPQSDIIFRY